MKRIILILALALAVVGASIAQSDVDPNVTLGNASRSELFRSVFQVPQSVVDSARAWYSDHASQDTTVSEDVLFDEVMSAAILRLRELEEQYLRKQAAKITTTF